MPTKFRLCFFLFLAGQLPAQTDPPDPARHFPAIDARARRLDLADNDIIRLNDTLTAPYASDTEKARAIFTWIATHIAYDCGSENRLEEEPAEAIHPLYYTQLQLQNILKTRRTRCDGYAFLFRLMCRLSGIYCTEMEGYARFRDEKTDPATVLPNHSRNAALLDGEWFEIDPTAGAGYCDGRRFRARLDEASFRMAEQLIQQRYIPIEDGRRLHNQGKIKLKKKRDD